MIRKNARLRKEYLYRKGLEGKEREQYEKKRRIRQALDEGKPIPTELRIEAKQLKEQIDLEDENTKEPRTHIDDEYANAGIIDPKLLITTSRNPSGRLTQFSKEMKLIIPNSQRVNRGGQVLKELVDSCRQHAFTDMIIVHEHRGEPDGLVVCHLPYGPTAYFGLRNVVLRHDIGSKKEVGTLSEQYPHLIFENFSTQLGSRVRNILKFMFPVPNPEAKRIITMANKSDYISFRHHVYQKPKGNDSIQLTELGPRFDMNVYQIKLGTADQISAENEWILRAYIRSNKKSKLAEDSIY